MIVRRCLCGATRAGNGAWHDHLRGVQAMTYPPGTSWHDRHRMLTRWLR